MEAARARAGPAEAAVEMVRRWPRISGEAKWAWWLLWRLSRGGRERICVTPSLVGADQGRSDDAGRRCLLTLLAAGLVLLVDRDKGTGVWTLELPDPADVARARKIEWDGQLELEFGAAPERGDDVRGTSETDGDGHPSDSSACDSPFARATADPRADPRSVRRGAPSEKPSEKTNLTQPLPSVLPSPSEPSVQRAPGSLAPRKEHAYGAQPGKERGSAGGSAAAKRGCADPGENVSMGGDPNVGFEPATLGAILGGLRLPTAEEQGEAVELRIQWIQRRVRDPALRVSPCLRVAEAIVFGEIKEREFKSLLDRLDDLRGERKLKTAAWCYFVGGARKIFQRHAVPW